MEYKDYYQTLGVPKTASEKDIKLAYRKLARQYHPDVNSGDKGSEAKFKEINEAYEVLGDAEKRKKYDEFGAYWDKAGSQPGGGRGRAQGGFPGGFDFSGFDFESAAQGGQGGGGFSDFFNILFGGMGGGSPRGRSSGGPQGGFPGGFDFSQMGDMGAGGMGGGYARSRAPQDLQFQLPVTLEEAAQGVTKSIALNRPEPCPACGGTGRQGRSHCPSCRGTGRFEKETRIQVTIPAGVKDGSVIRLRGQGGQAFPGAKAADILLTLKLLPHPVYQVEGSDLRADLPLSIPEAFFGGEIEVPTLKGKVTMKIPPRTQSGQTFRLGGQGLGSGKNAQAGNLYLKAQIRLPETVSPEMEKCFSQLKGEINDNPRSRMAQRR